MYIFIASAAIFKMTKSKKSPLKMPEIFENVWELEGIIEYFTRYFIFYIFSAVEKMNICCVKL